MVLSTKESIIIILVISIVTFLTRVLPFILFPAHKKTPDFIVYLSGVLPYAIIGMLVVYCLKEVRLFSFSYGIPEFISVGITVILHLWKRNVLISIGGGTLLYMLLVQLVF